MAGKLEPREVKSPKVVEDGEGSEGKGPLASRAEGREPSSPCRSAVCSHSVVSESATPWTSPPDAFVQGISWQEYWSGLSSLRHLPNPGKKLGSALQANALPSGPPGKPFVCSNNEILVPVLKIKKN